MTPPHPLPFLRTTLAAFAEGKGAQHLLVPGEPVEEYDDKGSFIDFFRDKGRLDILEAGSQLTLR
jgi:hypothetical protein